MFKLIGFCFILALIQFSESAPVYQFLPPREGYVPVYIRLGDMPLAEINPELALAFHESNIRTRNVNDLDEQMVNDAPSNDDLSESVEDVKEKELKTIQKDSDSAEETKLLSEPSNNEPSSEEEQESPKKVAEVVKEPEESEEEIDSQEESSSVAAVSRNENSDDIVSASSTNEEASTSSQDVVAQTKDSSASDDSEESDDKVTAPKANESNSSEEVDHKS